MIREAIEKLFTTFESAQTPKPADFGDCKERFIVLGGTLVAIPPPLPSRVVHSLDDLIGYGMRIFEADENAEVEVYYSIDHVVLLPNCDDTRIQVCFPLEFSKRCELLLELSQSAKPLDQRAFVRMLYAELYLDSALITPWRKMDFHGVSAVSGEVMRGRDRMGRDVTAQAVGVDQLPEVLPVPVPIFDSAGEREVYTLECRVDIDAATQKIALLPDPIEMHKIVEHHLESIGERLRGGMPRAAVYHGETPDGVFGSGK